MSGSSVQEIFRRLGAPGAGTQAFLGVAFLIVAVLVAFVAAGQMMAARAEESEGRLDHLLVGPLSRSSWLGGRLLVSVIVLVASGLIAGVFMWLGMATQHSGVDFGSVLGAGLNVVPASLCVLGIGALAFGLRPRMASLVIYGLLGWSLLVELVGGIGALSHWVLDTSVFHQMASAPAVPVNWKANALMAGIGIVSAGFGTVAFRRRDLAGQ
jgi:ABC-2 type transport system permease protein